MLGFPIQLIQPIFMEHQRWNIEQDPGSALEELEI